jgi:hypothetical protein
MTGWIFREIEKGIPERNPRETEFFRITSPGEAVVREFIQNSLDARRNQDPVKIKIFLNSIRRENIKNFLDNELKDHLNACSLIDRGEYPEDISYLVLEDFNTTGLDGSYNPDAGKGNFYNFWWREGISEKRGQRAGRWGLGKTTFHIVSKIRTLWGLTVRDDGKILLMGKALLRTHSLPGKRYDYFGYFSEDNFMPVEDDSILTKFRENFRISRNNTETGLSVVIPLPVDEINFQSIMKGVIQHYYYPVLAGILSVEIHDNINHKQEELNSENLIEKASDIDWSDTEWNGIDIRKILEFIKDSLNIQPIGLQIHDSANPEISQESFGGQINIIKENFLRGDSLRFEVPVTIRKTDGTEQESSVSILLKRFPEFRKPFEAYIRSGILISEIRMLGNRPVAGLLIAEEPAVCEFLGDCETPAHTNWNERTEIFVRNYRHAARILRFIKKSMLQIISLLDEPPRERQVDFLKDIFFVPIGAEEREEKEESTRPPIIPEDMERKPAKFNIEKIEGGFKVTLNPERTDLSFPFQATVKMAYDTRGGNPFKAYDKFDFDVGSATFIIKLEDCNVIQRQANILKVEITGRNFELTVTGFDPKRDLVIDVK